MSSSTVIVTLNLTDSGSTTTEQMQSVKNRYRHINFNYHQLILQRVPLSTST